MEEGNGQCAVRCYEHHWGMGVNLKNDVFIGGIYMASNVDNSCRVWNCQINNNDKRNGDEIIGKHGDIEHLRPFLGEGQVMKANTMYWITDRTPHESLPIEQKYRQYFRFVTAQVSLWFEDHSTPNPLGVVPDPNITKIIKGSKFGDPNMLKGVDNSTEARR